MAAPVLTRSLGMLLLAIWLVLTGITTFIAIPVPPALMGVLALAAGVLMLIGR